MTKEEAIDFVFNNWENFDGPLATKMYGRKVERARNLEWNPPILSFTVERHGGVARGGTRAEIQGWEVNVETMKADGGGFATKQMFPRAKSVNAREVAQKIAEKVFKKQKDKRIRWKGESVWVMVTKVFPDSAGLRETMIGRRKRFQIAIHDILTNAGYKKSGHYWSKVKGE